MVHGRRRERSVVNHWLRNLLCGVLIGVGAILPGVSGGVLAVVFGTLAQSVLLMVIRDRVPLSVQTGGYRPPACAGGGWGPGSGPGGPEVWWGPPPPAASGGPEARWQQPLRHEPPAGAPPENPGNPES